MIGSGISALGVRRMLLLRPTTVDVEARLGSGDGETEATGVSRTAMMRFARGEVFMGLRRGDLRAILGKRILERRYIGLPLFQVM